jgi:carbamoyl-phosphate synthase large subunit
MQHDLAGLGVRTWLRGVDGARACIDKAAFYEAPTRHRLPIPRTWLPGGEVSEVPDGVPLVVKPRYGQGSKGVYFCSERLQAAVLCELVPGKVIQERVTGREFTADCLAGPGTGRRQASCGGSCWSRAGGAGRAGPPDSGAS